MTTSDGSTASYYELPEGATELQHLISHRDMNAQIGEVFRACYRYGQASHSDMMRDAKKIRFYAQAEIDRLEKLAMAQLVGGTHLDFDESRIDAIGQNGGDGEHYAEEMSDPANWRAGDLVECVNGKGGEHHWPGKVYQITKVDHDEMCPIAIGHEEASHVKKVSYSLRTASSTFRFHSRPSQVNEKEMSGAWIVHDGGQMPCDELSSVEIEMRDGDRDANENAGFWNWNHFDTGGDIIRYRML